MPNAMPKWSIKMTFKADTVFKKQGFRKLCLILSQHPTDIQHSEHYILENLISFDESQLKSLNNSVKERGIRASHKHFHGIKRQRGLLAEKGTFRLVPKLTNASFTDILKVFLHDHVTLLREEYPFCINQSTRFLFKTIISRKGLV